MPIEITAVTDVGQRPDNQDSFWAATIDVSPINGNKLHSEGSVVCVCDGMGGLDDGGHASRTVIEAVRRVVMGYEGLAGTLNPDTIESAIKDANTNLYNETNALKADPEAKWQAGMGTTCTVLIMVDGQYQILHIGDSRAYQLFATAKTSRMLTNDHTAFQMYQERGRLKLIQGSWFLDGNLIEYRKVRSFGNKLTRCVGIRENIEIVRTEGVYTDGDGFLLSSDGFWHLLEKVPQWAQHILDAGNLEGLLKYYVEQFKVYGGTPETGEKDNQTVVVVRA